ncbi:GTP pyrophosphokinase [Slackia heliotrinireducens]|uniref:GTP pyrophosphokinase n=1 Tax=Slackia heliotrinireducens TaxID=84110 RepID=UPI0033157C2B
MLYTPLTELAMRIAYDAHHGQVDRAGLPYVFHPYHLAEQMDDEDSICVALLHDVVEDTDTTLDDLRDMGFPAQVVDALALLTHDPAVPYMDYVATIKTNPLAAKVKLADLTHNSDLTRLLGEPGPKDLARREKYLAAMELLRS